MKKILAEIARRLASTVAKRSARVCGEGKTTVHTGLANEGSAICDGILVVDCVPV